MEAQYAKVEGKDIATINNYGDLTVWEETVKIDALVLLFILTISLYHYISIWLYDYILIQFKGTRMKPEAEKPTATTKVQQWSQKPRNRQRRQR